MATMMEKRMSPGRVWPSAVPYLGVCVGGEASSSGVVLFVYPPRPPPELVPRTPKGSGDDAVIDDAVEGMHHLQLPCLPRR